MVVTILFLTTLLFFHLNVSSTDLLVYPGPTIFRETIALTLNSEKICNLYKIFHSQNPSFKPQNVLPPDRFFKSHKVFTTDQEQKILYNFQYSDQTPFCKFNPILFNFTKKTLEPLDQVYFRDSVNIPDGHFVANIGNEFFPFRPELNTQPLGNVNQMAMMATQLHTGNFFLILEDNITKEYSIICHGEYHTLSDQSVCLYESGPVSSLPLYRKYCVSLYSEIRTVETITYPEDLNFILKAKYISGIKKYFFKFQYGHIKISQMFLKNWNRFLKKIDDLIDWCDHKITNKYHLKDVLFFIFFPITIPMMIYTLMSMLIILVNHLTYKTLDHPTKGKTRLQNFFKSINFLFFAYRWMAPYKLILAAVFSPLYFYFSPQIFCLAFNLEPLIAALFWGPTHVYRELQFSENKFFQIYPLNQMFIIPTLKTPIRSILWEFLYAWFVMIVLTLFVYPFFLFEKKMSGEFLE